ncbi:MAG: DUF721 domain-containing protein [Nitrospira sp.]|nr:DUF721 domain-containing protein [Nitrospira sp.]
MADPRTGFLLEYAMAKAKSLDSFGTILSGLAKRLGLETRLLELRLQHDWHDIIGKPIASHTWPAQIRFKKLYLIVQNSVWLQQLTFLKPTLLAKLRDAIGTELIGEIVLRVGEVPSPRSAEEAASPGGNLSEVQIDADTVSRTIGIQDLELRDRFTKVISRYPSQQAPPRPATDRSRGL